MGYTRYWTLKKEVPQEKYDELVSYAKAVAENEKGNGIEIGKWDGEGGEPEFTKDIIALNGVGDDDSHESFVIPRKPDGNGSGFCKTARKPYDTVVFQILYLAKKLLGDEYFEFSSDGDNGDNTEFVDKILNRDKKISKIVD